MNLLHAVFIFALTKNHCVHASAPKDISIGDLIPTQQEEGRSRSRLSMINKTRTKSDDRIRTLNAIDDSQRVSALVMLARQNVSNEQRLPVELHHVIHQYFDYNEIRTLFQILTSSEDRKCALGFESYDQMHQEYPTRSSKISYLKTLRDDQVEWTDDAVDAWLYPRAIKFGDDNQFIVHLTLNWSPIIPRQSSADSRGNPKAINWNAVSRLKHLKYLRLGYLKFTVSMQDISSLPDTLRYLDIAGCIWTEPSGDMDLSLLPRGLREFNGCKCEGMTGLLKLAAPHSNLTTLVLENTGFQNYRGLAQLPPFLYLLNLLGTQLHLTRSEFDYLDDRVICLVH